jgi:hypothetical protein
MIVVPVGVRDDELVALPRVLVQPAGDELVDRGAQRAGRGPLAGAGVQQQRALVAE